MPHGAPRDGDDEPMPRDGDQEREAEARQHRRVERTLEAVDDETRRHDEQQQVHDAANALFVDEPRLAQDSPDAHEGKEDGHLFGDEEKIPHVRPRPQA